MIAPYALEVTFNKTVHVIFPSSIRYVDLGSIDLLAAKADGLENVLRVKAASKNFRNEGNLSVVTEDGSYYTFNVKYVDEPVKLSVEMADFLNTGDSANRPNNDQEVFFEDLGNESPRHVALVMKTIHKNNRRDVKDISSSRFGVQHTLKGIYVSNDLLYFHTELKNSTNIPFQVDYTSFRIADKKMAKRTAMQERVLEPVRVYNQTTIIGGKATERMVFVFSKFTLPEGKQLVVEVGEKDGGRHQKFTLGNGVLVKAKIINNLKIQ
jgi:conjugative transposon TraN protein